jgi:hypothetical protein
MQTIDRRDLEQFVSTRIISFHDARLGCLERLNLSRILRQKNPYLFRAKNVTTATELVTSLMDAFLSSSEEKIFGDFLEELAIYVSEITCQGKKSRAEGIDLEFDRDSTRYLVSIKSGPNWGNSSQYRALEAAFSRAAIVQRQARHGLTIRAVLGICYGKRRDADKGTYLNYTGQSFWQFSLRRPKPLSGYYRANRLSSKTAQ